MNLIDCKRCKGNACAVIESPEFTQYKCFGCGFETNTFWNEKNEIFLEIEKTIPELYKALAYIDKEGNHWFPITINHKTKGMIFAEGTSVDDWKWTAVLAVPIEKKWKWKYPPTQTYIMDMKNKHTFEQKDFIEALDVIGYFKA